MARRLTSPFLIGRAAELDSLLGCLARAGRGEPGIVTIAGDAGIGKSRLIAVFEEAARSVGARTLRGGCVELGGDGIAFEPVVEALRELIDDIGADGLVDVAGHQCAALARLVHELPAPSSTGDPSPDQGDLFEELFVLLRRLGAVRTLVLVIEDLHWADRSTRDLVRFLGRNLRAERLMLVLSFRSDDVHRRHPLAPLLAELDRHPHSERLTLAPFGRDDVAALAASILDAVPDESRVQALVDRSDGNPFYIEELIADGGGAEIPGPVRAIVTARAAHLPEATQSVLRVASLIGRRPTHSLIAGLSTLDAPGLTVAIRDAVDAMFLLPEPDDRYAFRHELVREALYDDLLPAERTVLHGRLAALIEASPTANDAEAAFHWGLAHESGRALAAAVRAADTALEGLAFGEAATLLLRALELWPVVTDPSDVAGVSRSTLLERAAEATAAAGDPHEATRLARLAAAEIDADLEPDRWLALAERLAWYEFDEGDAVAATRTLRDALGRTRAARGAVTATLLASLAELQWSACAYDEMRDLAREAKTLAAASGDRSAECRATALHAASLVQLGEVEEGFVALRDAQALADNGPATDQELVRNHLTQMLVLTGQHALALAETRPSVVQALERGTFGRYEVFLLANHIDALMATGAWDEVAGLLDHPGRPRRGVRATAWMVGSRAELLLLRGDIDLARETMREYRARTPASASVSDGLWLSRGDILLALAEDDPERACAAAWMAIERAPDPRRDLILSRWILPPAMTAHAERAQLARAIGDATAAAEAREAGERITTLVLGAEGSDPAAMHPAFRALCAAEAARINGRAEPELWLVAARALDAVPEAASAAYAWFRAAQALLFDRDRRSAIEPLHAAWLASTRLGARPLITQIEELARRARLTHATVVTVPGAAASDDRPEPPVPAGARFGLSRRELEVLTLVAEGRTNREIGEVLFITPKTASVHVTHILDKLGVSSRIEAALLATQSGLVGSGQ